MKVAAGSQDFPVSIGIKTISLVLVILVGGVACGVVLFLSLINHESGEPQQESLLLSQVQVWYNQSGWAEAAIVVVNVGEKDVTLRKVTARGIECVWSDIYYWKAEVGPVSDELEPTSTELSGPSFSIVVDGISRIFQRASNQLPLESGYTMVLYLKNPGNITSYNADLIVTFTVFTENKLYYEEASLEKLSFAFIGTEQLTISSLTWTGPNTGFSLNIDNTGTKDVTITQIQVNYGTTGVTQPGGLPLTLKASADTTLAVTFAYVNGTSYDISVVTSSGYKFTDHFIGGLDKT